VGRGIKGISTVEEDVRALGSTYWEGDVYQDRGAVGRGGSTNKLAGLTN
jgi:hypothetical protein